MREVRPERAGTGEVQDPSTGCQAVSSGGAGSCNTCGATIGGTAYCSKCSTTSEAPVDGVCKAISNDDASGCKLKSPNDGTCTQCGANYFLHKGGCYKIGGAVGGLICADTVAAIRSPPVPGVCTKCRENYFKNPSATDNTHQSCIACNEAAVTDGADTYKGVVDCSRCSPPATPAGAREEKVARCTKCITAKYLSTTGTCVASCTQDVQFSTEDDENGKRCFLCSDATNKGVTGCAKCTYTSPNANAICTECQADRYLKAKVGDTAETCETKETCTGGYFPKDESTGGNKCVKCSATDNGGIADCSACTPIESPTTTVLVKCSLCGSNKKVSSGGSSCATDCPENSTGNENACICNSGFAPSGDSCVASSSVNLSTGTIAGISVITLAACSVLLIGHLSL